MVAFTFAGQYGPEAVINAQGDALPGAALTVFALDGVTPASLYTDRTKATAAVNPFTPDTHGNCKFFADPGRYVLSIEVGTVITTLGVIVPVDPDEPRTNDLAFLIAYGG